MRIQWKLSAEILDTFVANHAYGHHMKTSMWGTLQEGGGGIIHKVGFYDEEDLCATALIEEHKGFLFPYWYIPFGPCVDYENEKLLQEVLDALKDMGKKHNVCFIRIDPNIPIKEHKQDGTEMEGYDRRHVAAQIHACEFQHLGYRYGYSGNWQPRFTYVLNIDKPMEQLVSESYKENANYWRKNQKRAIRIETADVEKLCYLEAFGKELAKKLHFAPKTAADFQHIMESYPNHHRYCLALANLPQAFQNLQEEIGALQSEIDLYKSKARKQGLIKEISREMENLTKECMLIQEWILKEGEEVILGAGLFVYIGNKSYDLYLYSSKALTNFRSAISMHYDMMEWLRQRGVTHYDFVGISGSLERSDMYFGLYDFKRRFQGDFIEYPGEFDWIHHPLLYQLTTNGRALTRRIERKWQRMKTEKEGV